jgi:hypothetical protein
MGAEHGAEARSAFSELVEALEHGGRGNDSGNGGGGNNGGGDGGEHGHKVEPEQSADEALAPLVASFSEGTRGIVDTVRDVTSRGVPGWSRLSAGRQFGGVRGGST